MNRDELLRVWVALLEHGWGVGPALEEAKRGLQAVDAECAQEPDPRACDNPDGPCSCGATHDVIRVKPDPVAWRHGTIISNEPIDRVNDTPLYEPEDA